MQNGVCLDNCRHLHVQKPLLAHPLNMRYLLVSSVIGLLAGCSPTFAQTQRVAPASDNAAWMDSVQRLSLPHRVAAVQARAWRDTLLAPFQPTVDRIILSTTARPAGPATVPVSVQPGLPLLYVVDKQVFFPNDAATIRALQRVLTARPIRQVTVMHAAAATALYGSRGVHGAVWLSSKRARRH